MKGALSFVALSALLLTAACTVGPRYVRPSVPATAPDAWKTQPPWQPAAPKDTLPKGEWWQVFHDDTLNGYEQQLLQANQALVAARDRLNQARSLARIATAAYFPIDAQTLEYLRFTNRSDDQVRLVEAYAKEQGLFHTPESAAPNFSDTIELDLGTVEPSLAGPSRPQDRDDMMPGGAGRPARLHLGGDFPIGNRRGGLG